MVLKNSDESHGTIRKKNHQIKTNPRKCSTKINGRTLMDLIRLKYFLDLSKTWVVPVIHFERIAQKITLAYPENIFKMFSWDCWTLYLNEDPMTFRMDSYKVGP